MYITQVPRVDVNKHKQKTHLLWSRSDALWFQQTSAAAQNAHVSEGMAETTSDNLFSCQIINVLVFLPLKNL